MAWINTDIAFDWRQAIFVMSVRRAMIEGFPVSFSDFEKHPDELEAHIVAFIEKIRPELKGCQLLAFNYNIAKFEYTFCIVHRSLPRVALGDIPEMRPLFDDDDRSLAQPIVVG